MAGDLKDNVRRGDKQRKMRNKRVVLATVYYVIAYCRKDICTGSQVIIGYFCQNKGVSKRAITVLNQMGVVCFYHEVQKVMRGIAESNLVALKTKGILQGPHGEAWDNAQIAEQAKAEYTLRNRENFVQSIAGFVWFLILPKPKEKDISYFQG